MSTEFIESLPSELIAHVTVGCGQRGVEWIGELESTVGLLERRWSIVVDRPFAAGEFNYVAPATRLQTGESVVLKIAPPWQPVEIFGEAAYLEYRNGEGCIRLLAMDRGSRAILLERALPGANYAEHFVDDKPAVVGPGIRMLQRVLRRPSPHADVKGVVTLDSWFDKFRIYETTDFPQAYARNALEIYDRLSRQDGRVFYLHGDYHPGNIVTAEREESLVIDPKGIIGHIGYDLGVFLNNHHWWQETEAGIKDILALAVRQFSDAFGIDQMEVRQWAYAQMVIGSWWNYVDMPELYDGSVVKADIWDV